MSLGLSVPPEATILLLDSEPVMRAALRDALETAGYLVRTSGDLSEALDRLAETPPDLLITRPYINSMPGRIAADYLRSKQNGLPVLLVGGFLKDDRVGIQNTVEEFHTFPKPYSREELIAKVKEVLNWTRRRT
jgi:DNA-binding NtrC family response regulator